MSKALGGDVSSVCTSAVGLISDNPDDLETVAYGMGALKEASCEVSLGAAETRAMKTLKSGWGAEGGSFRCKRLTLLADLALGGGKILENVETAVKNINKHRSEDGSVLSLPEGMSDESTDGTFQLLEIIAATKVTSKGIKKTLERAADLLPGAEGSDDEVDAGADATLLSALATAVADAGGPNLSVTPAQGEALARILLKMKGTASAKGAYKVFAALHTLATKFPDAAPEALVLATPVIKEGAVFRVECRNILGGEISGRSGGVELEKVVALGQAADSVTPPRLEGSGGALEATFTGSGVGVYELSLKVGGKDAAVKRFLVVQAAASLINIEVGVSPSRAHLDGKLYQVPLRGGQVKASALEGEYVSAAFTVAGAAIPQQAFFKFTNLATNSEILFAAKRSGIRSGAGSFVAVVSLADEVQAAFGHRSGEYQLSLVVGDVGFDKPLEQDLGALNLTFSSKPAVSHALYRKPLLWESDTALSPLPEIHHQFRQPERRPNAVLPAAFTFLVALALTAFFRYLPRVGANLNGFPSGGMALFWNIAWLVCLLMVLFLFTAYWVFLKGMTTLKLLFPLGVTTLLVGHRAFVGKVKAGTS